MDAALETGRGDNASARYRQTRTGFRV